MSPGTAAAQGLAEEDDIRLSTTLGSVTMKVSIRDGMPDGLVRVPHGWWKPEQTPGLAAGLSGAMTYADAQLCRDDPDYLDREQGVPHLKGVPCRLAKVEACDEADVVAEVAAR